MKQKQLLFLLALLMTAATGAWAQTGMINGLFSVSPTKRVYFSKGNLQYDGTNWKFAASQWEVLGANGTGATGTATNYPMDFFTWGNIDSPTYNGTTYYTGNADLSGITDWGSRMGSGWYTLSKDEWLYLFGMEENNTDKSGHARYRKYFRATVNGVKGIVLLPDDLSGISDIPAESNRGTASNFAKTYTTDAWSAMESAGCVFLPTAGFRKTDASVSHVGWSGFYWESTAYDASKAYTVGFDNTFVDPAGNFDRTFGFSVRLVIDQYYLTLADGTKDADKWTATVGTSSTANPLPVGGLNEKDAVTLKYNGRLKVKGVKATSDAEPDAWDGDLSKLTAESTAEFATATDGMTITGRLGANVKVSIAADATVTLDGVTIVGNDDENYKWAGLNCLGDATIILKDRTQNRVQGFHEDYPGIHVPAGSRLTITGGTLGNGMLTATSSGYGAGIGGGNNIHCGNIDIQGGYIAATGGIYGAGIGGGLDAICGNITISGGTVRAMGGPEAAGIGGGSNGRCGGITITNGVTLVFAAKGGEEAPYSIGAGNGGSCVTVSIGGTVYWQDNAAVDNDANAYLGQSSLLYRPMPEP